MKNFTKQNFKTNPLWIRLLIMTLMVLLGSSSAWADVDVYVYAKNSSHYAYIWTGTSTTHNGGWPGKTFASSFTSLGNNLYKKTITGISSYNIIFNEGNGKSQTSDIKNISTGKCFFYEGGTTYKTEANYEMKGTYAAKFTSFDATKKAYSTSSQELDAGTYTTQVYSGSSKYWSSFDNTRGSGVTLSGGGQNGFSFTLTSAMSVTFYYDPGADKVFAVGISSTYTVKKSEIEATDGTVKLGDTVLTTSNKSINSGSYDLSITAPTGYNVSKVEVSGGSLTTAGTTGSSSYTGKVNVSANTTVTVTYAKLTYSISYNANGGSGAPAAETKTYGVALTLSSTIPTRTGYTFQNWNTASNGSGTTYKSGASYTANEAATLYAQWTANQYKITYKDQGGAAFSGTHATGYPTTHTYGAKTTLKDPTKSGYNFLGWFTKSDCSGTAVASLGATAYTADITLYARWEKICVPETSITSAELQQNGTISLAGNFTTCGAKYHGFQWRKVGSNWCGETGYANNKESNYVTIGNTDVNGSETASFTPEEGVTYEFRTYIVTTSPWLYSTSTKEVSTCVTVVEPAVSMSPANGSVCQGSPVTLTLTTRQSGVVYKIGNEEIFKSTTTYSFVPKTNSVTVTASHEKACDGTNNKTKTFSISIKSLPEAPVFASSSMTVCAGEPFSLPKPTNLKEGTEDCIWSVGGKTTTGSQPGISQTTVYTAVKNDGCPSPSVEFTVNVTPIPTITGATYTQPGRSNAITLTAANGILADWSVDNGGDLSKTSESNTTEFSAEANGIYTIIASNGTCTATHVVTVSDAFYVYMRQPKKGETAYNNFYYPTQNPTQGGDLFYKEYASIPPAEGYTDYNKGGVAHDIIFTDCDGYVWYGFKASDKLIDGTNYFTVHAPNKNGYDGWFTHTDITKPGKMTGDIYYIMGTEGNGNSGWKIEEASAPYSGPVVHASGNDFSFNKNNFADFVALYVTDCSGKEIDYYQWQYSQTENGKYDDYSSVCTYVGKKSEQGDAGKTNNIRPNVAGWYRCTATYKDGSSLTSAAKQVTATSGTSYSFTSDLPIIMVNTNGYGFPSCDGLSGTASKNADVLKAKISVDVKIYEDETLVYDRKARMNYRGSSSLNFVKKSYAFCPGKADCVEDKGRVDYVKTEKLNMLGVGSAVDKDWVLYAAAADPSIMRNRLMFDTFRDMTGTWSVQSRYVELIVDGEYKGIYVFMDKITNNENRINIDDSKGGFILKFDKTDLVDRYEGSGDKKTFKSLYSGKDGSGTYDTQIDQRFEIEYPEMEDVEEEEAGKWAKTVNKIKSMFNNFETQLKAGNYAEVQKIIDYNSWADWFIITEFAKNMDAYRASNLFVYNGDKIEARPLWDQELSFKNYCATLCDDYSCDNAEGLLIRTSKIYDEGESCSAPFWFTGKYVSGRGTEAIGGSQQFAGYLLNDPCFVQTIKDRWNEHKGKALSAESLNAKLERYTNEMATALDREKSIWKSEGGKLSRETCQCSYNGTTGYSDIKISESIADITEWINARPSELEEALNDEVGTGLSISFSDDNIDTTPWEPVILQVHNESGYDYVLTYTDNALDQLTGVIIEKNGDTYKYNIPRPANWGTGDEATEGERANIVYGLKATLQMDSSNVVCGSQAEVPFDEATITLQDEPNEDCVQP